MRKLYQILAAKIQARLNCIRAGNEVWELTHRHEIEALVKNRMPSGSGVDCGTKIDLDESEPNRLVFTFSYHHMDSNGFYDGWTEHRVIVTPDLAFGFNLKITGRDRNQIKEYLTEIYSEALEHGIAA